MAHHIQCYVLNLSITQALCNLACYNNFINCAELTPLQGHYSVNLLMQPETISYAVSLVIVVHILVVCIAFSLVLLRWTIQLLKLIFMIIAFMIGINNIDEIVPGGAPRVS